MVLPGPSCLASRIAPATLMPVEPPRHRPFVLEQIVDHRHGFLVRNQEGVVDLGGLDDGRDAAEPDAFGDRAARRRLGLAVLEQFVHRRAMRIGAGDHDVLVLLLQIAAGAGERAAGADRADEAVDLAAGLLPDFRAGRFVMRLGVVEIVPLVGEQHAVRLGLAQLRRRAAGRHAGNCSDWNRAAPALRSAPRRTAAACPSFPGSAFPESRSGCGSRARSPRPQGRCRYCRRSLPRTRPPGLRSPRFSASRIIHLPARSFTDWPGFMNSALPRMVQPVASEARFSLISGVLPIASTTSLLMFMSENCRLFATVADDPKGPPRERTSRRACADSRTAYAGFANTTWRTSIFPDRNPASQ